MAQGIASSPALYGIYKSGKMLEELVGGINIPSFMTLGTGFDLNTTVANLMMSGAMAGGIMNGIGAIASSLSNGVDIGSMLKTFGINSNVTTVTRGTGIGSIQKAGTSVSSSGYAMNGNSADIQNKTLSDANNSAGAQLAEAVDTSDQVTNKVINDNISNIYTLLSKVVSGEFAFNIKQKDFGLTG